MSTFEILCVTTQQKDFSKIKEMNICCNVVFANQSDYTAYEEMEFNSHKAKMVSTQTRGVGVNRNLALMYATADICLLADDDLIYRDDVEKIVLREFELHPDADIFIFNLESSDLTRKQQHYLKTKKCGYFTRMPWGGCRIAFRLNAVKKANLWFSSLFGGGCVFPEGEDSMWLLTAKRAGLTFYVSKETIANVSFEQSSWFTGYDKKFFYGKGAYSYAVHRKTFKFWKWYLLIRYKNKGNIPFFERGKWMEYGKKGYKKMLSYRAFCESVLKE